MLWPRLIPLVLGYYLLRMTLAYSPALNRSKTCPSYEELVKLLFIEE